ncbi:MAG TPA: hypothetical protein VGD91_27930 [Trebonia sp.]
MTEYTDDGRYIVVAGRRWRATDPMIPPQRSAELRSALMAWRRQVKAVRGTADERPARDGVQAAKVALGERGDPWWEQTDDERRQRWEKTVPLPQPDPPPDGVQI